MGHGPRPSKIGANGVGYDDQGSGVDSSGASTRPPAPSTAVGPTKHDQQRGKQLNQARADQAARGK